MKELSASAAMSILMDPIRYEDEEFLKKFLAAQLSKNRLTLVLGAGVSFGFGLPTWDDLLNRAFEPTGLKRPAGLKNEEAAEYLLNEHFKKDRIKFANNIRSALYEDLDISLNSLRRNDFLASVGAITMVSRRGSISKVVTFNFDDLLETYLTYHGFYVESVSVLPIWNSNKDLRLYHPHGFLPNNLEPIKRGIVFTQSDYDSVVGDSSDKWRSLLLSIFRSSTCIFIGLSGADTNLSSILTEVSKTHVSMGTQCYWGIRFSNDCNDPRRSMWQERGIYQQALSTYDLIPTWLFEICQKAALIIQAG